MISSYAGNGCTSNIGTNASRKILEERSSEQCLFAQVYNFNLKGNKSEIGSQKSFDLPQMFMENVGYSVNRGH